MTQREVRRYRKVARGEIVPGSRLLDSNGSPLEFGEMTRAVDPLIDPAEYTDLVPQTDEACAFLAKWRPVLYGYGGVFAEKVYEELLALRAGPLGLLECEERNDRVVTLGPLMELKPNKDGYVGYRDFDEALSLMTRSAIQSTISSPEWVNDNHLVVPYAHLSELIGVFAHLDRRPEAGRVPLQFSSPEQFFRSGFGTARRTMSKNSRLAGQKVDIDSDPKMVAAIALASRLPVQLAGMQLGQMFASDQAISSGVFALGAFSDASRAEWDLSVLGARSVNSDGMPILEALVEFDDLIVPKTCRYHPIDGYDLKTPGMKHIRDLRDETELGNSRPRLGCLALSIDDEGGDSVLVSFREWHAELTVATGIIEQQLGFRRRWTDKHNRSCEVAQTPSLASRMILRGLLTPKDALVPMTAWSSSGRSNASNSGTKLVRSPRRRIPDVVPHLARSSEASSASVGAPLLGRSSAEVTESEPVALSDDRSFVARVTTEPSVAERSLDLDR